MKLSLDDLRAAVKKSGKPTWFDTEKDGNEWIISTRLHGDPRSNTWSGIDMNEGIRLKSIFKAEFPDHFVSCEGRHDWVTVTVSVEPQ